MCKWCDNPRCTITKKQVLERGPILQSIAESMMRPADEEHPATYSFKGVPCFNSVSALIPDEDDENLMLICSSCLTRTRERRMGGNAQRLHTR